MRTLGFSPFVGFVKLWLCAIGFGQRDAHVGDCEVLGQVFAVGRLQACDALAFGDQLFQNGARYRMDVAQIDERLGILDGRSGCRQEIPTENQVPADLIAHDGRFYQPLVDQLLCPMDACDENAIGFPLGQIAGLSQNDHGRGPPLNFVFDQVNGQRICLDAEQGASLEQVALRQWSLRVWCFKHCLGFIGEIMRRW